MHQPDELVVVSIPDFAHEYATVQESICIDQSESIKVNVIETSQLAKRFSFWDVLKFVDLTIERR